MRDVEGCVLVGVSVANEARRIALHFRDERATPFVHFDVVFWEVVAEYLHRVIGDHEVWYLTERPLDALIGAHWTHFEAARPSGWPVHEDGGWSTREQLVQQLQARGILAFELDSHGQGDRLSAFILARSMTQVERKHPWLGVE
jgi:hypothetical protein